MLVFRAFLLITRVLSIITIIDTSATSHFEENLYTFQMRLVKLRLDAMKQSDNCLKSNFLRKK